MEIITVADIIKICKGTLLTGSLDVICENFSKDTRTLQKGEVYIGIKGENFDGNLLYEKAFAKGASVCVLQGVSLTEEQKDTYQDKTIILVEDTIKALSQLASYKRSLYSIPVIAITGSVGKTSTKDMIASVVAQKYRVLKTQGNFNNHIGLPFTILQLKDEEALVVEMGMNHFGEISYLTNIAKPTVAVITNIGTSHIGNLGSRENILKAKLEILEGLSKDGIVIINEDNDLLRKWEKENTKYQVITYGIDNKSDFMAEDIKIEPEYSNYFMKKGKETYSITVPISGKHFVSNSLCAIAVGEALQIDIEDRIKGIKEFELTKKRMDVEKVEDYIVINDSYNASYDSMKPAIEYLKEVQGNKKIAVLGDMLELGDFSKSLHEKVGEEVYYTKIDNLITVGELAKDIATKAIELGFSKQQVYQMNTKKEAIDKIRQIVQTGDVILLKASNSMKFTEILEDLKNKK